jgi:hypothetical protein
MPFSTIFQLYRGSQIFLVEETGVPGENHPPVIICKNNDAIFHG